MSDPFIAEIRIFAGTFAPAGWAFCNGQLLPIAQNTALFSLIGTTYGGDGEINTALPNLEGRVPMHPGDGPGLTSRRLGEKGGVSEVTLSEAQIADHDHELQASPNPAEAINPDGTSLARSVGASVYQTGSAATVQMAAEALPQTGGGQAHNNMHPYLALNFIIALVGIFPSRN